MNPTFQIVDLENNNQLDQGNFEHIPSTIIEVYVNQQRVNRMKQPFNIILESNDERSKLLYKSNSQSFFRCSLPKPIEFQSEWIVTLKDLHVSNKIYNIQGVLHLTIK